jgi:uncharacterized membrane protein YqaE (UPF0057 family)
MKKSLTRLLFVVTSLCIFQTSVIASGPIMSAATSSGPSKEEVNNAVKEFKSLPKSERREKMKEVKQAVKDFKKNKKKSGDADTNTLLLVILAILLPPLAVYLHEGEINTKFWISLLLTILFWIPGVIYALIVILGNG